MTYILADHNIEGQAAILWGMLSAEGWSELLHLRLVMFAQVGLPDDSSDRQVWRFAQENKMLLLTANRRMREEDSLEQTIREENTPTSLPVLTIANVNKLEERVYRDRCITRILEIVIDLKNFLGTGRIFIP
jgi:hypothetical protein